VFESAKGVAQGLIFPIPVAQPTSTTLLGSRYSTALGTGKIRAGEARFCEGGLYLLNILEVGLGTLTSTATFY